MNIDASFEAASSLGMKGVVIRDEDGKLLAAAAKSYKHIPDTLTAEVLAARDGLTFAALHCYDKEHLEVDNLPLVNLLQSDRSELSTMASIWQEIQELSRSFVGFKLCFMYREGNMADHVCAGLASASNPDESWLHSFPPCLVRVTETDCNLAASD